MYLRFQYLVLRALIFLLISAQGRLGLDSKIKVDTLIQEIKKEIE